MLSLGRSSVDITPPVGIPLGGWPFERRGERVHRPLTCRALVLRDDIQEVVIVTLDLLGTSTELADAIRGAVTEATGVPATKVLLASSHTHSGPIMPPCLMRGLPPPDEHYLAALEQWVVTAVTIARREQIEVQVGADIGSCDLAVSRRRLAPDGSAYWPPRADPDLVVDRSVGVVRFEAADGSTPALILSYGCHPTVAGPSDDIGPDYPGRAREELEQTFPGSQAYFLLGNAGDVRSDHTKDDGTFRWDLPIEAVEEAGGRLGQAAAEVASAVRVDQDGPLGVQHTTGQVVTGSGNQVRSCSFHALRVGPVDLVTNPAETFTEIGLQLRERWPRPLVFASLTNGFIGYVPTKPAYRAGGYEVDHAYEHFGLDGPLRDDSAEVFLQGMHDALSGLPGAAR
jgi:hypothetical protein